jgi:hypothetical protein
MSPTVSKYMDSRGDTIQQVGSVEDLGLIIPDTGKLDEHIEPCMVRALVFKPSKVRGPYILTPQDRDLCY